MKRTMTIMFLLAAASVSLLIFPIAESGRSSMDVLARLALLPAAALVLIAVGVLYRFDDPVARASSVGLAAGALATVALEAIRLPGFWLGFMPGNLPRLMGVLLLNQFATGPSLKSDIAGWAYHFWNGASFGLIYVLVFGTCRRWVGTVLGILLGWAGSQQRGWALSIAPCWEPFVSVFPNARLRRGWFGSPRRRAVTVLILANRWQEGHSH